MPKKSLIILYSYHHKNTEKIAKVIAKILDAPIMLPQQIDPKDLKNYSLIGFGSGIYGEKHHKSLLELVDKLPQVRNKNAFIFSTAGITGEDKVKSDHSTLREKLESKGYIIVDDFGCKGFNTNSFLKYFGGMNKGRPNADDLKSAEEFAQKLKNLREKS